MMKGKRFFRSFVMISVLLIWGASAMADVGAGAGVIREHFLKTQPSVREVAQRVGQEPVSTEGTYAGSPQMKSPGMALLFSAAVPGAGELYIGAEKRAIGFFAVEVASWTWYLTQHSSGKDKEDEYMDFAGRTDQSGSWKGNNWSEGQYFTWYSHWEDWYDAYKGDNDPDFDKLFTHHLPPQVNDDYYEMIGKYDQFSYGWIDSSEVRQNPLLYENFAPFDSLYGFPPPPADYTTRDICRGVSPSATRDRDLYVNLRGDANKLLKRATWGISVSLFNHVISALDAALAARAFNRRVLEEARYPQLRMELDRYAGEVIPKITISQKF
jgi:hypothetical protein